MGFDLVVSAQRDPLAGRQSNEADPPCASHATVALNGGFDEPAARAVLNSVSDLARDGARSIVVEMQDVEVEDASCLEGFASGLMEQRGNGVHVQVNARHAKLHARLETLPGARDWLLVFAKADTESARVAIHVDGLNAAG